MKSSTRDTRSIESSVASVFQAMGDMGADAVVLTNKPPMLHCGVQKRYGALDFLFGFKDEDAACLFCDGRAYFVTDSRYELELKECFSGLDSIRLSITGDDPEDSCFLSIVRKAQGLKSGRLCLVADEKVIHSRVYLSAIRKNEKIVLKKADILDLIFSDRPAQKDYCVEDVEDLGFPHSFRKIFTPRVSKLNAIVSGLAAQDASGAVVFSNPSDIAWILNIRCPDNPPSLMPPSILILFQSKGFLFVQGKLGSKLVYELSNLERGEEEKSLVGEIIVFTLDDFFNKAKYLIPISSALYFADLDYPAQMLEVFPLENYAYRPYDRFWFDKFKAARTQEEAESMRLAFKFDSIAFARLMSGKRMRNGFEDEASVCEALLRERKKNQYFIAESFPAISAFGSNGAIVHYAPPSEGARRIEEGLLVLDFGSQYDFGTTDSTRTISFGNPTDEERFHYTAVLKSHIFLQMTDFPFGVDGYRLDFLARSILYSYGIEVPHAIGHGVEICGNVHATFPRLSFSLRDNISLFKIFPGMIFTIEPGSYVEGKFGVRIENTVLSVACEGKSGYMRFEPLTLMPYDLNLIDRSMLSSKEMDFINGYHRKVREALANELDDEWMLEVKAMTREL